MDMRSRIRSGLLQRGMPSHVADAFIMNMQDESGLNPGINEIAPLVPGSRGGFGLYQLTGPRRRQYEAFAQQRGVPAADVDAQLDFLMHELETTESRAAKNIFAAQDTGSAAAAIVNDFLRPAEQHRARRVARYTGGELTGGGSSDTLVGGLSIQPAAVPDLLEAAPMQAEAPGGLLGRLFPDMSASRADEIRLGINGLLHNPNQGQQRAIMARMGQRQLDQREAKAEQKQAQQANKTAAWLAQQPGGQQFAEAIASGALPANAALQMWRQQGQGPEMTALQKQYAQDVAQGYQGTLLDYQLELKQAGAAKTEITNTVGEGESAFAKETGKIIAQQAGETVQQGATAQRSLGQINELGQLLEKVPEGAGGAFTAAAGNLGLQLDGVDEVQAAEAIISRLVPEQRPPGTGPMSDADLELFKRSLPRLINSREGNRMIVETLQGVAQYDIERGRIAQKLQLGQITQQQAYEAYNALGDPLEAFKSMPTEPAANTKRLRYNPETGEFE